MFSFTFLGTGCPVASPVRAGPAHLVSTGEAKVLVDCGSGVSQRLVAAGVRAADIDALVITHYHSDHIVDFYQLLVSSWHQGRTKPWIVHAPGPAIQNLASQIEAYSDELGLRTSHEKRPSTSGLNVEFRLLFEGPVTVLGDLTVRAFPVDHRPVTPAFGLIFEAGGKRIVFSGDTRPVAALSEAAKGADLLVQEVFVDREMQPVPGVRSAETIAAVQGYHTTPAQAAAIASEAGVKALALTHIVPPAADRRALAAEVRAGFAGPVIVGEDLMTIDIEGRILSCRDVVMAY